MNPQNGYIIINGRSIHFLEWGNADDPAIVLLHGLFGNAHYWDFFADELSGQYHILAIDQRGHGDSNWAETYGPDDYVADLEEFIDATGYRSPAIIGHSMGGITAMLYASRHQEQVSRLVVVDIGPELESAGTERILKEIAAEPDCFDSMEDAFRYVRDTEPFCSDSFIRHQLKTALKPDEDGRLYFKFDRALRRTSMRSPDWLWEHLGSIVCPTLILRGKESDILSRKTATEMAEHLLIGSVVEIEGAGHGIPGDKPELFLAEVKRMLCMNN